MALKLLPGAVAKDPERMSRFEREAKVLASVNHPNIATLFGLERVEKEGEPPRRLRELIGRCLRRNPKKRVRDLGDVRLELLDLAIRERRVLVENAIFGRRS